MLASLTGVVFDGIVVTLLMIETRQHKLAEVLQLLPQYRQSQVWEGLFMSTIEDWDSLSTLPKELRATLKQSLPWVSLTERHVLQSKCGDTYKALLETADHKMIETVLMQNSRGFWSICVSSQVGCAMACTFCATGKMGFTRNLTVDEIIDQYRFWLYFLRNKATLSLSKGGEKLEQRISNLVYMGMGE
ncbi:MAG: hypothetical protein E6R05_07175, partial [Candidatus Moraniibacteriota bacterium]